MREFGKEGCVVKMNELTSLQEKMNETWHQRTEIRSQFTETFKRLRKDCTNGLKSLLDEHAAPRKRPRRLHLLLAASYMVLAYAPAVLSHMWILSRRRIADGTTPR
jgi:septal ring factor EnvC (AmiA/AmiB activator)